MPADSDHEAILDAVEAVLPTLALDGTQDRVKRLWVLTQAWLSSLPQRPCLVYAPVGNEADLGGTTGQDDWGYPVVVRIVDTLDVSQTAERMGQVLKWRRIIKTAFHNKRLAGVPGNPCGLFQTGPVVEPEPAAYEVLSSPLAFQFARRRTPRS